MKTMKAILFESPGRVRPVDGVPAPTPEAGEVLVRCTHVGLCGSNVGPYLGIGRWAEGDWPRPPGWMGHENVGIIVESYCEAWPVGSYVLCQSKDSLGFAEYVVCRPETLTTLTAHVDDLGSFVIAQPLATVLRALSRTRPVIGERCAVVGQGPIGLMFTYLLQRMGAGQVIAIDVVPWRLDLAKRLGATYTVHASGSDTVAAVRELTDGAMVDLCVEAVGETEAIITAAYLPRWRGRLCLFGVPDHDLEPFPWFDATNNETEIVLSRGPQWVAYAQTAVDMVAQSAALRELVTPRLPWEEAPRAFEMYAHPADYPGALKIVLEL